MGLIIKGISGVYQGAEIGGVFEELIGGTEKFETLMSENFKERCVSFKPESDNPLKLILEKTTGGEHEASMGSYRDFNNFREHLAECIIGAPMDTIWNNISKYKESPLFELIDFVDDAGCICYEVATKVHKDLVDNKEKFETAVKERVKDNELENTLSYYKEITKAFEAAADHGIIVYQ